MFGVPFETLKPWWKHGVRKLLGEVFDFQIFFLWWLQIIFSLLSEEQTWLKS